MSEKELRAWMNKMATKLMNSLRRQGVDITHKQAFDAFSDLTVGEVTELVAEQKKKAA